MKHFFCCFPYLLGEEQPILEVTTASDNQATAEERAKIDFLFAKGKATSQTPNVT